MALDTNRSPLGESAGVATASPIWAKGRLSMAILDARQHYANDEIQQSKNLVVTTTGVCVKICDRETVWHNAGEVALMMPARHTEVK